MHKGKLTRYDLALFTFILKQRSCSKARIRVTQEIHSKLGPGSFSELGILFYQWYSAAENR